MAPLTPHWPRPSHPEIQVIINDAEFTSMSRSRVSLPPFAVFAKMTFPPCTLADKPTYATVQIGRDRHLNLNSDLLYINHSCDPSLIFDTGSMNILVGPKGLRPGDELTFFYPSTEWDMAQPFECLCKTPACRGRISGASTMPSAQLEGLWLNGHILELLRERDDSNGARKGTNGTAVGGDDPTAQALRNALEHAELVVQASRAALASYHAGVHVARQGHLESGVTAVQRVQGADRRGVSSRELSGEMGGDTIVA